jgi:hypothetical protein
MAGSTWGIPGAFMTPTLQIKGYTDGQCVIAVPASILNRSVNNDATIFLVVAVCRAIIFHGTVLVRDASP